MLRKLSTCFALICLVATPMLGQQAASPTEPATKEQILKEWPPNGFKLVKEFDGLPWQHLMFFARDDSAELNRR